LNREDYKMKLLVATDGSKNSLRAIEYAAGMLGKLNVPGSLTLLSVHDDAALRHARRFVGKQAIEDYLRELSDADLAEAREMLAAAKVPHEELIRTGHIATEIANAGDEGGYDLIVLGSKGRTTLQDFVIGSVAKRVMEISRTPVLLVR
jgi:nucleotide-binding universal stress UspA family protein